MPQLFEHKQHLVRVALLFAAGLVVFLIAKAILVPASFGEYGHYRGSALEENRTIRPISYAGRAACTQCHDDMAKQLAGGKHHAIGCESCHGPLARHAEDPDKVKGVKPDGRTTCLRCHTANIAKPKGFPQIEVSEHSAEGACIECHVPHAPSV